MAEMSFIPRPGCEVALGCVGAGVAAVSTLVNGSRSNPNVAYRFFHLFLTSFKFLQNAKLYGNC